MRWRHLLSSAALAAALALATPPSQAAPPSTLVWGENLPAGLDPHAIFDVPMQFVLLNVYDTLFRYVGQDQEPQPWLAESHTVSDDGLTWTVKLKSGVTFHDGSPLKAQDVVYSFQRLLKMGRGPAGAFKPVLAPENVTATDDTTVSFKLNKPYAPFFAALPLVAIVNPRVVEANVKDGDYGSAWLSSNDAGSGAYRVDPATYQPRVSLDLKRFPEHFYGWSDNPKPIEMVKSRPSNETSTRVLAVIKGETDSTDGYLPADQVARIEKAEGARVARDESMRIFVIRMNNTKPPFDNADFRHCISYAFNYDGFNKVLLKGLVDRNPGPIPKNLWGNPADLKGYSYDLKQAKAFCDKAKAAGAPIDREMEIHNQAENEQAVQASQMFQSDLRKIGLNVRIVPSQWPTLVSSTAKPETTPDMWVHWVSTYFVDPENWIGQMYDSQFHGTWKASSWYRNDKVDQLLREARGGKDRATREKLYAEASKIIVDEAPDIWVYNTIALRGLTNRVKGYKYSPVGGGSEARWMSVEN